MDGFFGKAMILAILLDVCFLPGVGSFFPWIAALLGLWLWVLFFNGEFDPGSGRTLAACLTHASRAERLLRGYSSGERVSNT
jgi:hypothetical protein